MGGASIRTVVVGVGHEGAGHFLIELFHRVGLGVGYIPSQDLSCNALHGNKPKFLGKALPLEGRVVVPDDPAVVSHF